MVAQFKQLGTVIAPGQAVDNGAADIGIMTCNWSSFEAFRACDTQWRFRQIGDRIVYVGLDYPACRLVLDDIGAGPQVFSDLREMERAALPILNDQVTEAEAEF